MGGKGAVDNTAALSLGGYGVTGTGSAGKIMHEADLVIAVGTRLTDFTTGSQSAFNHPNVKFISINVCGHDAFKEGALPLVADASEALKALLDAANATEITPNQTYLKEVATAKDEWRALLETDVFVEHEGEAMSQLHAIHVVNKQAMPGDSIVTAAGGPPGDLHQLWDTSNDRRCLLEFGFSCMGFEIPAGLGIRMAQPRGEVYVLIGDGTYLMQPTELATASQENLKVTLVVLDNHGFQIIRRLQMGRAGISFGNEFRDRNQESMRLEGDYVEIAETEPHRYGPGSEVWWDVAAAEVSARSETQELRKAYESDRADLQRFHY